MRGLNALTMLAGLTHIPNVGEGDLSSLFANGENGFLLDPMSDLTRLFTTVNGPPAVAANDDTVALMLDNAKWGGRTSVQVLAAQTELVTNGDFSSGVGWGLGTGWVVTGGQAVHTPTGSNDDLTNSVPALTPNKFYAVTYTIVDRTVGITTFSLTGAGTSVGLNRSSNGTVTEYIQAVASHTTFRVRASASFDGKIDNLSIREIPGNHALQPGSTLRPLWKANSGKPYILPDGVDDALITPFIPTAALTMAIAVRFPTTNTNNYLIMGGGVSAGNKRAFIGKNATTGTVAVGWGDESLGHTIVGPDLGTSDHVIVLAGDSLAREIWLDGVLLHSRNPAIGLDGTGSGIALGYYNNGGSPSTPSQSRIYAALAMNRRATAAEIARITSQFQQRF